MAMSAETLGTTAGALMKDARSEWTRLGTLQKHIDGKLLETWMPSTADGEYRDLLRKAGTPWLAFVRDAIAQGCRVSGYTNAAIWDAVWRANGMDGRQGVVTRESVGLGKSYVVLLPGEKPDTVVARPTSAHDTYAVFADPWSEYPSQVLVRMKPRQSGVKYWEGDWYYIDEQTAYRFKGTPDTPRDVHEIEHGLGFAPVVQMSNTLEAVPQSSVQSAIPVYKRIVDATFTLEMVQRYGAFPQKWMAGGEIAKDADGNAQVNPSVDSLLHASGESGETARFGNFAAVDLQQVVGALDAHIKHLSAVCQVPPHYLLGAVVNMSAEGIAAAESGYHRNIGERQDAHGEGWELVLRTGAAILGDETAATSTTDRVSWENVAAWSLNQVSDAVVKLATVDAPLELLFGLVPGWSRTDAIEAAAEVNERRAMERAYTSPRQVAELIQKIYLGVGKVLTSDEAREIANRAGAGLLGSLPAPVEPTRASGDAGTAPATDAG